MKPTPQQTPRDLVDRAKAELAQGDYKTATQLAIVAIADHLTTERTPR